MLPNNIRQSFTQNLRDCFLCCETFALPIHRPMMLCMNQHIICLECARKIAQKDSLCPLCKDRFQIEKIQPYRVIKLDFEQEYPYYFERMQPRKPVEPERYIYIPPEHQQQQAAYMNDPYDVNRGLVIAQPNINQIQEQRNNKNCHSCCKCFTVLALITIIIWFNVAAASLNTCSAYHYSYTCYSSSSYSSSAYCCSTYNYCYSNPEYNCTSLSSLYHGSGVAFYYLGVGMASFILLVMCCRACNRNNQDREAERLADYQRQYEYQRNLRSQHQVQQQQNYNQYN